MKLWDEILQGKLIFWDAEFWRIVFNPLEQIDGPAASDIVGDLDHFDLLVFHRGKEYVVHIDESD